MTLKRLINGSSVVAVGAFMPRLLTPIWLAQREILAEEDLQSADINIIGNDVTRISLPWLSLYCDKERLSVEVMQEPLVRAQDIASGILGNIAEYPTAMLGINRHIHLAAPDEQVWHRLGDLVTPKEPWGRFAIEDGVRRAGMRSLTMERGRHKPPGFMRVTIEPSGRITHGVYFGTNDHYDLQVDGQPSTARETVDVIHNRWDQSVQEVDDLIESLLGQVS